MNRSTYIGFEGPIGAGKTTLARMLAQHLSATLILEDVDGNEFLPDFYAKPDEWSLPMQLWFLAARHRQLTERFPPDKPVIADYTFHKDAVFAGMLLRDRGLRLYKYLNAELAGGLVHPTLIVYIDADNGILIDRIKKRGRKYENPVTPAYEDQIRAAYEGFIAKNPRMNLIRYDTSTLDLASSAQVTELFERILVASRGTTS